MLFILEGPDGAGKSHLAERLRAYTGEATVLHRSAPKRHPLYEYESALVRYRPGWDEHIICDRWHLGEIVYPQVYGRKSLLTPEALLHIRLFLQSRGAVTLIRNPGPIVTRGRLNDRSDTVGYAEADQLHRLYIEVWTAQSESTPLLDMKDVTTDDLINIITLGKLREMSASYTSVMRTYVGHPAASVWLVGDDYGGQKRRPLLPCFVPMPNTSGAYLLRALLAAGFTSVNVGLVNSVDPGLMHSYEHCHPTLVALGNAASTRLTKYGLPHTKVPHPQYMRRFHHDDLVAYGEAIREAADDHAHV